MRISIIIVFPLNFVLVYYIIDIILFAYGETKSFKKKLLFAFYVGAIMNTAWSYAFYYLLGSDNFTPVVYSLIQYPNPIFAFSMLMLVLCRKILSDNKRHIKLNYVMIINLKRELFIYLVKVALIYFTLACVPLMSEDKEVENFTIFCFFCSLFAFFILRDMYLSKQNDSKQKEAHIKLLLRKTNAAQVEDTDKLSNRAGENPSLVAVLLDKLKYAKSMNVDMSVTLEDRLDNLYMDNPDVCTVVSCFLDNAIEAAAVSEQKRASFVMVSGI